MKEKERAYMQNTTFQSFALGVSRVTTVTNK